MLALRLCRIVRPTLFVGAVLYSGMAMAAGLQVSPISLSLQARENASGLTLSNSSNHVMNAQVRIQRWMQDDTGDQLVPSRELLASPPMTELKPGEQQLVRIIRAKAPPQGTDAVEGSYRILINEIPVKLPEQTSGLQFALSYSLPVFVQPLGINKTSPQLHWSMHPQPNNEQVKIRVSNLGNGHAKLSGLSFVDTAGNSLDLHQGLLGYVLPGATMYWTLKISPSALTSEGTFKVILNGTKTTPDVTLDNTAR